MLDLTGAILRYTCVVSGMSWLYGLDEQHTKFLIAIGDQYSITGSKPMIVEQPDQLDRSIALGNRASYRSRAVDIERLIPELKR